MFTLLISLYISPFSIFLHQPWKTSYHGLVRAIIRVNLDAASPDDVRARRIAIDLEAGKVKE